MIDMAQALAAAADQVHRTHCARCEYEAACPGFSEVDAGIAVAVLDTFLTHCYTGVRRALWDAHQTTRA